jgi:hypothetical protein
MFEAAGGLDIGTQFVCESAMETQLQSAPDSLQRSFAGLMLNYAKATPSTTASVAVCFISPMTSVRDYITQQGARA